MPTVGGRLTAFDLQGRRIALRDGRLSDSAGTLAGAHLGMSEAVARFWRVLGADDAALMAALTAASTAPARLLGLEAVRGQIAPGLMADIVALRRDTFEVVQTWQDGLV
jgi:N-acetylglucosamine-6-phosphate deacetylase